MRPRTQIRFLVMGVMACTGLLAAQVRVDGPRALDRTVPKTEFPAEVMPVWQETSEPPGETQTTAPPAPSLGAGIPAPAPPELRLPSEDDFQRAIRVVARFLELAPDQVEAFLHLLRMRQEAVAPLLRGIAEREQRIRELLESGGAPAEIGQLVIEIHQLRQLIAHAQAHFLAQFTSLLNEHQRNRWQQAQLADRLQPILPAFRLLHLL